MNVLFLLFLCYCCHNLKYLIQRYIMYTMYIGLFNTTHWIIHRFLEEFAWRNSVMLLECRTEILGVSEAYQEGDFLHRNLLFQ